MHAIGLHALQHERDPVISVARVVLMRGRELIAGIGPTQLLEYILIAVVLYIRIGDAVPFLQIAEATRGGHILKVTAMVVAKHALGQQRFMGCLTQPQVHVQPTVVVQVAKVRRHNCNRTVQPPEWGTSADVLSWLLRYRCETEAR